MDTNVLRFTTAGSVDDGKSTLIGRLLMDSKALFEDQIDSIKKSSEKKGTDYLDLSLFLDGLKSEREQGITIDVAYRYFATSERKFIIADTPGHIEYTRNMVTGASTADLALILIDARNGIQEQTRRHTYIASLLGIKHIMYCVNKMDLVDYSEDRFNQIVNDTKELTKELNFISTDFIPISALKGDNVVSRSENMSWFEGKPLIDFLNYVDINHDSTTDVVRLPIQYVIRPHREGFQDFRGFAGRINNGEIKVGDQLQVLPSEETCTVEKIYIGEKELNTVSKGASVTIQTKEEVDISRGDLLVEPGTQIKTSKDIEAVVCSLSKKGLSPQKMYTLKINATEVKCKFVGIKEFIDINTFEHQQKDKNIEVNDIAVVHLKTASPLYFDNYYDIKETGSFILIDDENNTVAAGILN